MSQEKQILSHLRRYGSIEPLTALDKYGCFRLAARINDLRYHGYQIDTEMVEKGNKRIARYRLVA
jgi:Helix-turn-helix domain